MTHRGLEDLINADEPGLELVRAWMADASNAARLLCCEVDDGERALLDLQITTRSPMGAIAHGTGGLLIDDGWIRVLGAGCPELPRSIATWNGMHRGRSTRIPGAILIGDDVVGGFFAISGGGIPVAPGNVGYYAPDTLGWEDTEQRYSDWLHWLFRGDLDLFYEHARWPGWREEVAAIGGGRALSVYPPLWAEGPPMLDRNRKPVPVDEVWDLNPSVFPAKLRANRPD